MYLHKAHLKPTNQSIILDLLCLLYTFQPSTTYKGRATILWLKNPGVHVVVNVSQPPRAQTIKRTFPLDSLLPGKKTGLSGRTKCNFQIKTRPTFCSETKSVRHTEQSEHPVPRHSPAQVAGKTLPCSATVLAWLISCSNLSSRILVHHRDENRRDSPGKH